MCKREREALTLRNGQRARRDPTATLSWRDATSGTVLQDPFQPNQERPKRTQRMERMSEQVEYVKTQLRMALLRKQMAQGISSATRQQASTKSHSAPPKAPCTLACDPEETWHARGADVSSGYDCVSYLVHGHAHTGCVIICTCAQVSHMTMVSKAHRNWSSGDV